MPQPKKGYSLGSNPSHQQLMLRNLARSLFEHEKVKTTEAKAKALRPFAEKLITKARKGTIHHRRQALALIEDREVVHKLFADIGPRFAARNGGYTRILKLGRRDGDGASLALIELVEGAPASGRADSAVEPSRRRLRRPGRRRPSSGPSEPQAPAEDQQQEAIPGEVEASAEDATEPPSAAEPEGQSGRDESAGESAPR